MFQLCLPVDTPLEVIENVNQDVLNWREATSTLFCSYAHKMQTASRKVNAGLLLSHESDDTFITASRHRGIV